MFRSYVPPIKSQNASLSTPDPIVKCTRVGDSAIIFNDSSHQQIAVLTEQGFICDRERFPDKTSKEFAEMVYLSLLDVLKDVQFERGKSPVKLMVERKALLEVGDNFITLHSTGTGNHFDQWAFIYLEKLWKERQK